MEREVVMVFNMTIACVINHCLHSINAIGHKSFVTGTEKSGVNKALETKHCEL